ncbi:MAG: class I SAM-dependent methyltransferase [Deltaproteobacteria bacterium]|nr:class I SAM-dependent methyltransferase [Deltaproteobacteria bacterium]
MPRTEPFDAHSDRYDAWFEKNSAAYDDELEAIRQVLPSPLGLALEVGVGSGKFAVPLGIRIGLEPSTIMARKADSLGIHVARGTAEDLPFPDNEFDVVLMVTTICFVDDIRSSFKEAHRVLRPGGGIIVGFVDKESALGKRYEQNRDASVFYKDATFFSAPEVCAHLRTTGFTNLEFRQTLLEPATSPRVRNGFGQGAFVAIRGMK